MYVSTFSYGHNKPTYIVAVSITIYTTCIRVHSSLQISPYSVPLVVAAEEGHAQTVERLLKGGAIINYQRPVCNSNCVHYIIHCSLRAGCMYVVTVVATLKGKNIAHEELL